MMRTALFAAAFALTTLPAVATDLDDMTDAERDAFRAEVRAYLLENPEVLMEAIAVLEARQADQEAIRDEQIVASNADALFASPLDWIGGNPDGDITVVEFIDYRCGFCRRAAPEIAELLEIDGNIRLVVKEFPILGEQSTLATRFALSTRIVAGDEAYEAVHHALISMRADMTEDNLARMALNLGLDGEAILDGLDNPQIDMVIDTNYALAQAMQITGTPTFVFGDQLVRGFIEVDQMTALVGQAREAQAN